MQRPAAMQVHQGVFAGTVLVVLSVMVAGILILMSTAPYEVWGTAVIGFILLVVSLPVLSRQATREGDRRLFAFLTLALVCKLGGALLRFYVLTDVYEGGGDATDYHKWGTQISGSFREGSFATALDSHQGTDFIRFLTGVVYYVIGTTQLGGFLVYSWLGFWGLFLFYRAFVIAVPQGYARGYARLLFFLPSLLFWPSSIGKESWMMLALGIAALGAARIMTGKMPRGIALIGLGMWMAGMVRPHMAGIVAVALAAGYLLRRPKPGLRQIGPLAKGVAFAGLAVVAVVLSLRADQFIRDAGVDTDHGVTGTLTGVSARTNQGDSKFNASVLQSPGRAPHAVVTVLFRPFPQETHNGQSLVASIESLGLLVLTAIRFRWGWTTLRSIRRQPYVGFVLAYVGLFIVAFSSMANFGILARQRVQLLPFYLILLCIPPRKLPDNSSDELVSTP